jgi:hypothetical protein
MAFSATVLKVEELGNGYIIETGTFNGASVTTGTITAQAAATGVQGIYDIKAFNASSDNDTAVVCNIDSPNTMTLTFQANDTGKYFLIGKAK